MISLLADIIDAGLDVVRPLERLTPSAFAARYRDVNTKPFPGPWDNENGPYLIDVMDAGQERLERGLKGLILMKSAQGGGTDAIGINLKLWCMTYYPGPYLYLTARDDTAEELSRDRWDHVLATCEPLKKKRLDGKDKIAKKRFTDSTLQFAGARSPNNYISDPRRGVTFDEIDSILGELPDGSDVIATIDERMSMIRESGATFLHVLAHPTTKDRGAGELYYDLSDQRRGHVKCPHCGAWMAPKWEHVRVVPHPNQAEAEAAFDPSCYVFFAPCCGAECDESDRQKMILEVRQRSVLAPEVAATKRWIGVHFWQFFYRSMTVFNIAEKFVAAKIKQRSGDDSNMRTFYNKVLGDVFNAQEKDVTIEVLEKLAPPEGHSASFVRGTVPAEVQWLTAGQDSRLDELHWIVMGWGLVRDAGLPAAAPPALCGWLVDWGVLPGPRRLDPTRQTLRAGDLFVFDQVLYGQFWPSVDGALQHPVAQGLHDSGWQPAAVYEYCRAHHGVAFPSKGAAEDDRSKKPPVTWTGALKWKVGTEEATDPSLKRADLNTFHLKNAFFSLTEGEFITPAGVRRPRLTIPRDYEGLVLAHLASERLIRDERGRRKWVKRGANHWLDCAVMAYAVALNLHAAMPPETNTEAAIAAQASAREKVRERSPRKIRRHYR